MKDTKQPPENALAKRQHRGATLVRVEQGETIDDIANGTPGAPRLISNINMSDPDERQLILKSAGTGDVDADSLKGKPFHVKWWMCEAAKVKDDKSDELVVVPRCTFFGPGGEMIAFTAWSIARYLDKLRLVIGEGPYDPPLNIIFRRVSAGGTKQQYECELVP